ncbi:lysozyme [Paraburkholderia sediminicola]|uniref:lysozyme n=1 Tax=Paraburkholderia sediminicola TaxID=458836 RepID=UPI0038B83252
MTEHFETCYLIAYPDPASPLGKALRARGAWQATLKGAAIPADLGYLSGAPWTCGWGSTGPDIVEGIVWTQAHADSQLTIRLDEAADVVDRLVKVVLTPAQKAALVDFTYNEGEGHLASSTLLKLLNAGNYQSCADGLLEWDMAGGEKLPGLDARRHANRTLFLTGAWQP